MEYALVVDMGMLLVIGAASRPAEVRDTPQRCPQGREYHLLAAGQAIEQGQGEGVVLDRRDCRLATMAEHLFDRRLGIHQAEVSQGADQGAVDGERAAIEANRADAASSIPLGGDFAGTGAAD